MSDSKAILVEEDELSNLSNLEEDENRCSVKSCFRNPKQLCLALFVGQVLAGLLGTSAVCAALIAKAGVNLPLAQNIPHYLLLFIVFGLVRLGMRVKALNENSSSDVEKKDLVESHPSRIWQVLYYCLAGCVDMHAFWAILAAYAYTNVTSIQLLDCLGIPTSMFLSYFILRYRYAWTHYVGAVICLLGAAMMIGADILTVQENADGNGMYEFANSTKTDFDQTRVILGDMLAILGAILYGVSSVIQEHLTHQYGATNYLLYFSLVAVVLTAIYSSVLEHVHLTELVSNSTLNGVVIPPFTVVYYVGYAGCMFCMDSIMAYTIHRISAVFINLSLLTADLYGLVAGIWLFHVPFHYLYFVSFVLIIIGAAMFAARSAKTSQKRDGL